MRVQLANKREDNRENNSVVTELFPNTASYSYPLDDVLSHFPLNYIMCSTLLM